MKTLQRGTCLLLTLVMLLGMTAFADDPAKRELVLRINTGPDGCSSSRNDGEDLGTGSSTVVLTPNTGNQMKSISVGRQGIASLEGIVPGTPSCTIGGEQFTFAWEPNNYNKVTITVPASSSKEDVIIGAVCEKAPAKPIYNVTTTSGAGYTISGAQTGTATCAVSVSPQGNYQLSSITVEYDGQSYTLNSNSGSTTWLGLNLYCSGGSATVKGDLKSNLTVSAKAAETRYISVTGDVGFDSSPSYQSVPVGGSASVRITPDSGYLIDEVVFTSGNASFSASPGQGQIVVGGTTCNLYQNSSGSVSINLGNVSNNMNISVMTSFDQNNIPVTYSEGSYVDIYTDSSSTVNKGEDVSFTISTTSSSYTLSKITLRVGSESKTVNADVSSISVDGRTYDIDVKSNSEVVLYVDNVRKPIYVSATSTRDSTVSRPSVTANSGNNVTVKKSVSSSNVDAGDDVSFTLTPASKYQIKRVTLKIGSNSATVDADVTNIKVGGNTYYLSRNSNGVITLWVTDIRNNVTVSATASYTGDSTTTPTGNVRINTGYRGAFLNGYPDGSFQPGSNMTRAEAVVMLSRMTDLNTGASYGNQFTDVSSNDWFSLQVNGFASSGIINSGGAFRPNASITRAELCEMLYRLSGSPSVGSNANTFYDIAGHSSATAIRYAARQGWVNGYPDTSFRPDTPMNRAEIAAMMVRVLGKSTSGYGGYSNYRDVPTYHWAHAYISAASNY